jgi:hypothetical protein
MSWHVRSAFEFRGQSVSLRWLVALECDPRCAGQSAIRLMTGGGYGQMQTLKIGDVTITSIIERDGPWR